MYQQITSEHIKNTFKEQVYSSGVLFFVKENIEKNNLKVV